MSGERESPITEFQCSRCKEPAKKYVSLLGFTTGRGEGVHVDLCANCHSALQVWLGNPSGGHFVEFEFNIGDPVVMCVGKVDRIKGMVDGCVWNAPGTTYYTVHYVDGMKRLALMTCLESELVADA